VIAIKQILLQEGSRQRTKVKVEWTLSVLKVDNQTTEYTNHIRATATANSLPSPRSMESHLNRLQRPPDRFRCTQRGRNSQLRCQNRTPCANEGMTRSPGARIQYLAVSYGGLFSGKESETAVGLKRRPLASGCEIGNIRCENLDRQANCNACGRQPVSLMSRLRSHWKNSHAHGLTVM
jgi:hypothetical protein